MSDIATPYKHELAAGNEATGIIPQTIEDVWRVANAIMLAKMVPASYEGKTEEETKAKLALGIMKGLEVGMGPITAISTIMIINNRPCVWGDGAVALCQKGGHVADQKTEWRGTPGTDGYTCVFTIWRVGQSKPYVGEFSIGQAKRAHLWMNPKKQPWILYPDRMMFNRARAFALRDGFADCLMGLSIAEEVQDFPETPKVSSIAFLDDPTPDEKADVAPYSCIPEGDQEISALAEMRTITSLQALLEWWSGLDEETADLCFVAYEEYRATLAAAELRM